MAESIPVIELINVTTGFGQRRVLNGVSLLVQKGEMVVIEGVTGAGKTTLVRLLLGIQPRVGGFARVLGMDLARADRTDLTRLRRSVGTVYQSPRFLDNDSVLKNVVLPLAIAGEPAKRCRERGTRSLVDADLANHAHRRPRQLSGGEQARLQIARALIHSPLLILADEPFAHLDPESTSAAEALLTRCHARGTTVFITTHGSTELAARGRRFRLENGVLVAL